jgi:ubiquinone/menaquinone biosynthesis C-methylase UbiE
MKTDEGYYDQESNRYSQKRYEGDTKTYVQFFYKNRRDTVLKLISKIIEGKKDLTLLDVGCADGVLSFAILEKFPSTFKKIVGTDISLPMIEEAKKKAGDNQKISFCLKDDCPEDTFDIALGLGYLDVLNIEQEMHFLKSRLKQGGYYLCTLASKQSLFYKIKFDKPELKDIYSTYYKYRELLTRDFVIIKEVPYGLFIPKLWVIPVVARVVQPILEAVFRNILPNLFHEKIYLLRKK